MLQNFFMLNKPWVSRNKRREYVERFNTCDTSQERRSARKFAAGSFVLRDI
jgi:hypothetical protein